MVKSHLSGMPGNPPFSPHLESILKRLISSDGTLIFSNPYLLDDVSFHPCVRHQQWQVNKHISFIPPDGQFKLMSYRFVSPPLSPPPAR